MRFFLVLATVVAAVSAATAPASPQECKANYDADFNDFDSTPESRCAALVELSKCLGGFPKDEELEKILVSDQSEKCEKFWGKLDAPSVRVVRGDLVMTVDDAQKIEFHRHRRETVNVFTMYENIEKIFATLDTMNQTLHELKERVMSNEETMEANKVAQDEALNASKVEQDEALKAAVMLIDEEQTNLRSALQKMESDTSDALSNMGDLVDSKMGNLDTKLSKELNDAGKSISDLTASVNKGFSDADKSLDTNVKALQTKIADPVKHMWSGGSNGHHRGSGWADFALDRVELDTAAPYFKKESNTRFKALKAGLYHIRFNVMAYSGNWCWRHIKIRVGNRDAVPSHHKYQHTWQSSEVEVVWPIKAGELFYMQSYVAGCSNPYQWHSGWYNRVQIIYMGQLDMDKCSSNQKLC
jgi:hypothetical protein